MTQAEIEKVIKAFVADRGVMDWDFEHHLALAIAGKIGVCNFCGGSGEGTFDKKCPLCNGSGKERRKKMPKLDREKVGRILDRFGYDVQNYEGRSFSETRDNALDQILALVNGEK